MKLHKISELNTFFIHNSNNNENYEQSFLITDSDREVIVNYKYLNIKGAY